MSRTWHKEFEEYAEPLIKKYKIPGVAVGIAKKSQPIYFKGFGYRNLEQNLEVTADTIFGLGSITKSFTCVAIMQLQEEGKLSIHDLITDYLPNFRLKDHQSSKDITIHHLMTNSSGLPPLSSRFYAMKRSMDEDPSLDDFKGVKKDTKNQKPLDTYEELLSFISKLDFDLLGPPGTHFSYSNDGFSILGLIIEKLSGKKYEEFIQDRILSPLEMNDTGFYIPKFENGKNITTLYASKEHEGELEVYPAPLWWDSPAMLSAGFLKSTVQDMLKYTQMFCNYGHYDKVRILSSNSIKEMMHPHIEIEPGKYYGYGLMISPNFHGTTLIEHGGNLKGIAANMCILPEEGISGIVLTNLAAVPATRLMLSAINTLLGNPPESSHHNFNTYNVPSEELEDYVGEYKSSEEFQISVSVNEKKNIYVNQEASYPVLPIDKDLFLVKIKDQEEILWFFRNANEEVTGVRFHYRMLSKI